MTNSAKLCSSPLALFDTCDANKNTKALQFIENMTRNTDSVQEGVLSEILGQNAETEYLKRFKLNGATDRDTFKSKVPVVSYDDLKPDIQRIANGDRTPILCAHPISQFLISSGTSGGGEPKLIPTICEEMERRHLLYSLLMPVMNQYLPGLDKGKALYFMFTRAATNTPSGLVARPVLTSYYLSDNFKYRAHDPYNVYTSPDEAILCPHFFQSMYTQMLCALIMRHEVLRVGAAFASGFLRAIRFLQLNWAQLVHDISTGTLNPKITDPAIKHRMAQILKPDQELANFITQECSGGNWERIITRIWPNTKYLDVIVTGTMAQYIPTLNYYSGGIPLVCTRYTSSECHFGLNLSPMSYPSDVSYTIMPNMSYFEFLPYDDASSSSSTLSRDTPPRLIDLADVELCKSYEIILTSYAGLCRYRVGDILQVTGFHNTAPQFRFVRRKSLLLSIDADKTDEAELQNAVKKASELLKEFNTCVVEYTSFADTKSNPGHYVIYWELLMKESSNAPTREVLGQCCLRMEESLGGVYRQIRVEDGSIGPLEIRVVKNGTFEELMEDAITRGASINQYKVPRCVTTKHTIELLDSRVESSHLSPALPHWSAEERG